MNATLMDREAEINKIVIKMYINCYIFIPGLWSLNNMAI